MKKVLLAFVVFALFLTSCGNSKKEEAKKEAEQVKTEVKEEVKSTADQVVDQVALGKQLFTDKTCASCHQPDAKLVGPSIKDIVAKYNETNGNIVQFLKGNAPAIVDTDPGQVAIMKANLDGFVKDLSAEELQALAAYMRSVK